MELDLSNSVTNEQSYVYIAEELTSVPTILKLAHVRPELVK